MIGVPGTAPPLSGALREEGILGHPHFAGQFRAFDLAAPFRSRRRSAPSACSMPPSAASLPKGRSRNVDVNAGSCHPGRGGDGMAGHAGSLRQGIQRAGNAHINGACHRAGRLGAQHSRWSWMVRGHARAARRARELLSLAAYALDRRHRAPARWAACCSISSWGQRERLARDFRIDCACAAYWRSKQMCLSDRAWRSSQLARPAAGRFAARRPGPLHRACARDYLPHTVLIDCSAGQ